MESELRLVLMILGLLAIIALVVHGFYTIRKNKQIQSEQFDTTDDDEIETVSKAKVVSRKSSMHQSPTHSPSPRQDGPSLHSKHAGDSKSESSKRFSIKDSLNKIKPEKPTEPTTKERVEPEMNATQLQMPLPDEGLIEKVNAESERQTTGDFFEQLNEKEELEQAQQQAAQAKVESESKSASQPEEVLILNVVAPEGQLMSGAVLLPTLLTLGFKFGEFNIFHRHEDASGGGDVLFSLANMFNPGTFDIDNIEQFTTQGVSLFLSLPVKGEAQIVFNMMHNAAKKIAIEFSGQVLDGQRNVLTRQTVQHYVERIREFERRQLLK